MIFRRLRIVALRNEKGSYNLHLVTFRHCLIVALRNEKGSYNPDKVDIIVKINCSTAK